VACHYAPALILLLAGLVGDHQLNPKAYVNGPSPLIFANPLGFVALATVGVCLSLGRLNFFVAWLLAWVAGFVAPFLLALNLQSLAGVPNRLMIVLISTFYIALTAWMWVQIQRSLSRRSFLRAKAGG